MAYSGDMVKGDNIKDGWLMSARRVPSPNFNQRPADKDINLLVIHNISLPPGQFGENHIEQFFTNQLDHSLDPFYKEIEGVEVSSHLFIKRCGEVVQFVSFDDRAWHAGASTFQSCDNCNDFSIGIELEGEDDLAYTDAQYRSLDVVTQSIMAAYPSIVLDRITGHEDISPGRKTDPGKAFDWKRYLSSLNH